MPTSARKPNRKGNTNDNEDDDDDTSSADSKRTLVPEKDKEDVEKNVGVDDPEENLTTKSARKTQVSGSKKICSADEQVSLFLRFRSHAADMLEWIQNSEDVLYAVKLGVALFLVLWPAFIASWNTWYSLNRGCK